MRTRRALLNAISVFLDQGARVIVSLIVTPILVSGLGSVQFGIWQVLLRVSGWISCLDCRPSESLKWKISREHEMLDRPSANRAITSAFIVWVMFVPVIAAIGAVFVLVYPQRAAVEADTVLDIRIAASVVVINAIILGLLQLCAAILRGMNLGYKRMGTMAIIVLLGGVLTAVAVRQGYGLTGIAAVQTFTTLLGIVLVTWTVHRICPWVEVVRIGRGDIAETVKTGRWFMVWTFVETGLIAGDVLLLSYYVDGYTVTRYVLTSYATQVTVIVVATLIASIVPGLGGMIGSGKQSLAFERWREGSLYAWVLATACGATVAMCNRSFVTLWVGAEHFAGVIENIAVTMVAIQLVVLRNNAAIMNVALNVKSKTLVGAAALVITAVIASLSVPELGIVGLCLALMIGRSLLTLSFPSMVRAVFAKTEIDSTHRTLARWLVTIVVVAIAGVIGSRITLDEWVHIGALGLCCLFVCSVLCYFAGMSQVERRMMHRRVLSIKRPLV